MKILNVAIVGCGRISEVYRSIFKELKEEINVVYAVDTDIAKAENFAKDFSGCIALQDYREALQENIDVLHLATPHYIHKEMAVEAMKKGINVLTEKPMAISLIDADEMINISEREDIKLGVIFQTRYVKGGREIKRLIEEGRLGKLVSARSYLSWKRDASYYQGSDWKGTWDKEGGGVLIDQAIHSIDRMQWLIGSKAKWVEGSVHNRNHPEVKVEDTAEALIGFESGCTYHLYATNCYSYDAPVELEIVGEKGRAGLKQDLAWVELMDEPYYEIKDGYDGLKVGPSYWGSSHITQVKEFYKSVRGEGNHEIDGYEGRKALELVLSIYEASAKKERIHI